MALTFFWILALVGLLMWSSVASYLRLLMRRLTPIAAMRLFQAYKEQRIRIDRERVGVSISSLHGAAMASFAVGVMGFLMVRRPDHLLENLGAAVLIVSRAGSSRRRKKRRRRARRRIFRS